MSVRMSMRLQIVHTAFSDLMDRRVTVSSSESEVESRSMRSVLGGIQSVCDPKEVGPGNLQRTHTESKREPDRRSRQQAKVNV
jgi:hypothetical protein